MGPFPSFHSPSTGPDSSIPPLLAAGCTWAALTGLHLTDGMERTFSGHTHLLIPLRPLSTWVYGTNLIILYALVYDLLLAGLPLHQGSIGSLPLSPRLCAIGSNYNSPGHCLLPPPHPHILIITAAGPLLWQAFMQVIYFISHNRSTSQTGN